MSRLWTPPGVSRDLADNTARHNAQVDDALVKDGRIIDYWNPRLKQIDERLQLVKAKDNARVPGMRPGFWHIVRDCTPGPVLLLPITTPDGQYCEPGSQIVDMLQRGDLQSERAMRLRDERDERERVQRERDELLAHEQRVDHMTDRVRSMMRAHVSMTDARPYSNAAKDSKKAASSRGGGG